MQNYLVSLSRRSEFAIVVLGAFGIFTATSIWSGMHPASFLKPHHTDFSLRLLTIYELVVLLLLGLFLRARGWSFARVGLRISAVDTLIGFGLAVLAYFANFFLWIMLVQLWPEAAHNALNFKFADHGLSLSTVVANSIVNPVFEELFVSGYVITALRDTRWSAQAVNVSAAIRLSYHLYQGIRSVVGILPMGLMVGYWYKQNGRLWPLIACHALLDFVALSTLVRL